MKRYFFEQYISSGCKLVELNGKTPVVKNWTKDSFSGSTKYNDKSNYGFVIQSDMIIIDVDPRNFKHNVNSYLSLKEKYSLPATYTVKTGSGGFHYYYLNSNHTVIRKELKGYPGIDFLSKGHQVLIPGSIHPITLREYVLVVDSAPALIPDQLLADITKPIVQTGNTNNHDVEYNLTESEVQINIQGFQSLLQSYPPAIQGEGGDNLTFNLACRGYEYGLTPLQVYECMLVWNERCIPTWLPDELYQKVKNAYEYELKAGKIDICRVVSISNDLQNAEARNLDSNKKAETTPHTFKFDISTKNPKLLKPTHNNVLGVLSEYVRYYMNEDFSNMFRKNLMSESVEFNRTPPWPRESKNHRYLSETDINQLFMKINKEVNFQKEIPSKNFLLTALDVYASNHSYHPLKEYLDGLVWDQTPRLDNWLHTYLEAEDNEYTRKIGSLTLIASVARIYEPGVKYDYVLILDGEQGIGKSTAVQILGGEYYGSFNFKTMQKDEAQSFNTLANSWIIELEELAGLKKAEIAEVKTFITKQIDECRKKFEKMNTKKLRHSIFIGTANLNSFEGYLTDTTGNRRFWPVKVKQLKKYELIQDRDQLFAEAKSLYEKKTKLYVDSSAVIQQHSAETRKRQGSDPWLRPVRQYVDGMCGQNINIYDLQAQVLGMSPDKITARTYTRLDTILNLLGYFTNNNEVYKCEKTS